MSLFSQSTFELATACFDKADYDCALEKYREVLKVAVGKDKQRAEIWLMKAESCKKWLVDANNIFKNKKYKEAKELYAMVIETNPNDSYAKQQIEKCNQLLGLASTTLNLSKSSLSFAASGGRESVIVTTNADIYSIQYLPNWCTLVRNKDNFVIECSANTSSSERSAELYVSAGNKSVRLPISQAGKTVSVTPILSLTQTNLNFKASGGNERIVVTTNSSTYNVRLLPSWCTVEKFSTFFIVKCDANSNGSIRKDYFEVESGGEVVRVNVSQATELNKRYVSIETGNEVADLYINGKNVGKTPYYATLLIGTYTITISSGSKTLHKNIVVTENGPNHFKFDLRTSSSSSSSKPNNIATVKPKSRKRTNLILTGSAIKPLVLQSDAKTFSNNEIGYSVSLGVVKTLGVYARYSSSLNQPTGISSISNIQNTMYSKPNISHPTTFNRMGLVGGLMLQLKPVIFYVGAGKGHYYHYKITDLYYYNSDAFAETVNIRTFAFNGLETDAGMMINFNKFGLTFGFSAIDFKYSEVNVGVCIRL